MAGRRTAQAWRERCKRTHKIGTPLRGIGNDARRLTAVQCAVSRADATHIGASDPHAIEAPSRMVPANVTVHRPAGQDSTVRYAGMYYREPLDRATGQPIEIFGETVRAANAAAKWLSKRPVADAIDSIIRPKERE
jgi:hypothetical protein